ncbi:hypothetical protein NL676_032182 [Syzygium grande]|nr:hypothetical protein NL676_032182 [Syzygium grande]
MLPATLNHVVLIGGQGLANDWDHEYPIVVEPRVLAVVLSAPDVEFLVLREGELVELPVLAQPEAAAVGFLVLDHQVSRARPRWWKLRKGLVGASDSWTEAASGTFSKK